MTMVECSASHQSLLCYGNRLGNRNSCSPDPHHHRAPTSFFLVSSWSLLASHICHTRQHRDICVGRHQRAGHHRRHHQSTATDFCNVIFGAVADVFLPTVVLYLLHLRGNVLRGVKGNTITPIASRLWRRILDWSWVILTFLLHMVVLGYQAAWRNNTLNSGVTMD